MGILGDEKVSLHICANQYAAAINLVYYICCIIISGCHLNQGSDTKKSCHTLFPTKAR